MPKEAEKQIRKDALEEVNFVQLNNHMILFHKGT